MDTTLNAIETLKSRKYVIAGMAIAALFFAYEWKHLRAVDAPPLTMHRCSPTTCCRRWVLKAAPDWCQPSKAQRCWTCEAP